MKKCTKCNLEKNELEFSKKKSRPDGLNYWCKSCVKVYRDSIVPDIPQSKRCTKCLIVKDKSEFRLDKNRTGLKSWCHRCELDRHYAYLKTDIGRAKVRRNSYGILRYGHSKNKAIRNGIIWDISKDQFIELCKLPCEYCGSKVVTTGSGLDRKDPNIGYTIDNVVPCCYLCNTMKWNYWSYNEMKEIGKLVAHLQSARRLLITANK
jgi:hypothetical protein